ncbi:TonB-dependent receptor [Bacteroidales bacterium]|jgi:hypothetical protein|uniref:TonB-dependent receptor n=1 Tax=Lepagella muris TaxID=3032870 RepID=A0AC61RMP7_9BACT|nr:TonB-dependent receptor [Lepagella muris]THG52823.1 TonB-dependent receptor [Bacteroidales bacterium]TKC58727.1 TonB-dependent receptor [Bacteroidales bacterium]
MKQSTLTLFFACMPAIASAQTTTDSIADEWERQLELNEVVVVARRPVVKQQEGKLIYLVKNDPYAKGLDGMTLLDRIPRVSVNNGSVSVAGKGNIRYIIDGVLMELDASAMKMRLQNLLAENIEKIELLTTPPSRYTVEANAVYISITTRNESLGTRGSVYGSLNQGNKLREYFSGSISHTTRRVEIAFDVNLQNYHNENDNEMQYIFADYTRKSSTSNKSHDFSTGLNALLRYKFTPSMNMGIIANYKYGNTSVNGSNFTDYRNYTSSTLTTSKSCPNNALTLTGFYDWSFGNKGERMELTYNYFNRHSPESAIISTTYNNDFGENGIDETGDNDYRFHIGKADFKLPYSWGQLETGISYTDILNSSDNYTQYFEAGGAAEHLTVNLFDYKERIAAAYFSASRSFGNGLWGKVGLRYEYTWTKGVQRTTSEINRNNYGQLFPTANLSWSKNNIGSFNLGYSIGMGRPNLWELNPFRYYSTTDEYSGGNPELKPTIYNNAEINYYGLGGLYAVLYTSFASDAITHIRRFDKDGIMSTIPYNCLATNKTGLYASYKRNIFDWWEMQVGGEAFHTYSRCNLSDFQVNNIEDWSGKIEVSANWMLNRQKTLKFNARFTHFFPWQQNMVNYESFQILNFTIRYALLNNRLNLSLTANDIFGWNKTKSKEHYADYTIRHTFNPNSAYVIFGISYTFGREKVVGVFRNSKEDQSGRTK